MQFLILRRAAALGSCLAGVSFVATAVAAPTPSFSDLLQRASFTAPRLLASAAEVTAAEGRAHQAAAWPNPSLALERENFSGTGPYRGSSQAQTTLSVSQPLEVAGQRGARARFGRAELEAARAQDAQARSDFAFDLAQSYAAAEAAEKRAAILADDLARAQQDVQQARALVGAGREGELRAVQAEAAAAGAQAELEAARADASESLARLSSLVGVAEAFTSVGPSLLARALSSAEAYPDAPPATPMVAMAEADREVAEQLIGVERKRALPNLAVLLGARRLAGDDATAMVGGVSLSLPLFDRNFGAIAAARAERVAADARLEAARLDVDAGWRSARAQAQAAAVRVGAAGRGEEAAREAYRLARIGYEAGRASLLELSATRRALTEAELRALDARLAGIRAKAAIARLAGKIPFGD